MTELKGIAEMATYTERMLELIKTLKTAIEAQDRNVAHLAEFIAAEEDPATTVLFRDAVEQLRRVGQAWQQELIRSVPDERELIERIPESAWTATAARTLAKLVDDEHKRARETNQP